MGRGGFLRIGEKSFMGVFRIERKRERERESDRGGEGCQREQIASYGHASQGVPQCWGGERVRESKQIGEDAGRRGAFAAPNRALAPLNAGSVARCLFSRRTF